jgi:hypothetical protein
MTTAVADAAIPTNIAALTPRDIGKLAERMFPKFNSLTRIWHRVLVNWCKAGYHDRCGTRWLVKTAEEFLVDLPYSKATVYRALKTFEDMGLIVKRQAPHIYGHTIGRDHCNWIALRYCGKAGYGPRQCTLGDCSCPDGSYHATRLEHAQKTGAKQGAMMQGEDFDYARMDGEPKFGMKTVLMEAQCVLHIETPKCVDHTSSPKNCSKENSSADAKAGESFEIETDSQGSVSPETSNNAAENSMAEKPGQKSLDEILANRKQVEAKKQEDQKDMPLKAIEAVRILQTARRGVWPHEPPMSASAKDGALLKQFMEKMRALKFTDAQIRMTLREVVLGWDRFRAQVKTRTGRNLPERPQPITFTWQFDEVVVFIKENGFTSEPTSGTVDTAKSMASLFGKK